MSYIIFWILIGGIAGWLASIVMGTNPHQGILGNIVVGILGALIGGLVSSALGGPTVTGFNFSSLVVATLGAVILLFVIGIFRRSTTRI